jgi:hypothetical protein
MRYTGRTAVDLTARERKVLFLVISTPLPGRPSTVVQNRKKFWCWIDPMLKSKQCHFVHARVGRGAVALFDVKSNEELHALLNGWAEIIPAHFELYPLIDSAAAHRYLGRGKRSPGNRESTRSRS